MRLPSPRRYRQRFINNGVIPMAEDTIDSSESEGAFNEFVDERIEEMLDDIINDGNLTDFGDRGSDIVIEMDDIRPPTFTYGGPGDGAGGKGNQGPGEDAERIKFQLHSIVSWS